MHTHATDTPKQHIAFKHPVLVLIRGIPGSGKSYLANALQQSIGTDKAVVLDPDAIDLSGQAYLAFSKALTEEGVDPKFHPYRWSRSRAYQAITSNQIVIWNQAFTNLDGLNKTVINLQTYAADHGTQLPVLVVEVAADEQIAKARVTRRAEQGGHDVSDEAFTRFLQEYRSFADEGYTVVTVHGEDAVQTSVATVRQAIQQLEQQS